MIRAIRIRLYPTPDQKKYLAESVRNFVSMG